MMMMTTIDINVVEERLLNSHQPYAIIVFILKSKLQCNSVI
jgi:hypothetical protein